MTAAETPVELRGAGNCSRQVHNFGTPAALEADRFIVCEVLTPAGNWSSYPPHKHDEEKDGETELEEIYYFETRVAQGSGAPADADAIGYQRVYASDERPIDVAAEVRTGDVVLVPYGWHGPAMAAPGYDLYYLNVMAGPDLCGNGSSATTPTTGGCGRAGTDRTSTPACRSAPKEPHTQSPPPPSPRKARRLPTFASSGWALAGGAPRPGNPGGVGPSSCCRSGPSKRQQLRASWDL
ncbi:5-deoxy-glucuronate isomerase [Arthrobacter sp. Hiyo8]|nr:5-deoxy-glucuronate isomerase [Arthrobacter sp. Hiyo8]